MGSPSFERELRAWLEMALTAPASVCHLSGEWAPVPFVPGSPLLLAGGVGGLSSPPLQAATRPRSRTAHCPATAPFLAPCCLRRGLSPAALATLVRASPCRPAPRSPPRPAVNPQGGAKDRGRQLTPQVMLSFYFYSLKNTF